MPAPVGTIAAFQAEIDHFQAEFFPESRGWLDELVAAFIRDAARRHLVIIGEPGVGKSAYIAHLAAKYLCPRDSTCAGGELEVGVAGVDPRAFLVSVGQQLGRRYGAEIFGEGLAIRGEVDSGRARDRASAVGVEIEEAYVSPFRRLMIDGLVRARDLSDEARLAGVRIQRVYDSTLAMEPATLLHEALLNPLDQIARLNPGEVVLLLVDGLDVALQQTGAKIIDVIPRVDNLRVVMTSRPGAHLARFPGEDKIALSETGEVDAADAARNFAGRNREDVGALVAHVLQHEAVIGPAVRARTDPDAYSAMVAVRSDGNFLFLRYFFRTLREDIGAGRAEFLTPEGVPRGLDDFYRVILSDRIRGDLSEERWEAVYLPVLGVLAVAQAP